MAYHQTNVDIHVHYLAFLPGSVSNLALWMVPPARSAPYFPSIAGYTSAERGLPIIKNRDHVLPSQSSLSASSIKGAAHALAQ